MSKVYLTKASCMFLAMAMLGTAFAVCLSTETEALEFVDNTSIDVPWTSSFTPLDSAWDSTGTQCVVVGNDTSGIQPSAWHYNEPSNTWNPIIEGSDATLEPVHLVENDDTHITYGTIQAAIDAASSGATLNVWSGTYYENVLIDKALTLLGNGSASTVINGGNTDTAVTITAYGVTFNGFTVTGGTDNTGILLYGVQGCRIENNTVEGNGDGICVSGSSDNIIKNNYIQNNAGTGIMTMTSPVTNALIGLTNGGGEADQGAMFRMDPDGSDYSVLHDFKESYPDGRNPQYANLIYDSLSPTIMYSTTYYGGINNCGVIYRTNMAGTVHSIMHDFSNDPSDGQGPQGGLIQSGNVLYGTTAYGGQFGSGTIYRINTDGTGFLVLYSFNGGTDGYYPVGTLVLYNSVLYGMTNYGGPSYGTIFRINTDGTGFTVLHSFTGAPDGSYPRGSLIRDTLAPGTTLYGMTNSGGASSAGTIFKINTDGTMYAVIYSFSSLAGNGGYNPYGALLQSSTTLYGMAYRGGTGNTGTIFKINTDGTLFTCLLNLTSTTGYYPFGSLVQDASNLYGFTSGGGTSSRGTVFSFVKATKVLTVRYNFGAEPDANNPYGSPLLSGTTLYGASYYGGTFGAGTIFKINTDGSLYTVLHNFDSTALDCTYPYSTMIQYGTTVYGTVGEGGSFSSGAIIRVNPDGSDYTIMHQFQGYPIDGSYPYGSLTLVGNVLYGTTNGGGTEDNGIIFSIAVDGSSYSILYNFLSDGLDGYGPQSGLLAIGTTLYGMTQGGGPSGLGTIFKINTDGSGYTQLYAFMGGATSGQNPRGCTLTTDGTYLYGTTYRGGTLNFGTIFRINMDGTGFTILRSLSISDGYYPYCSLVLDGTTLYGVGRSGGANNAGTIFKISTDGTGFLVMHNLVYASEGSSPCGSLTLDGDMLYGNTNYGGTFDCGTVFRIQKNTMAFTVLHQFQGTPNDASYPYYNDILVYVYPSLTSSNNIIYHNNIIGNAIQAMNDDLPVNMWSLTYSEGGGNYWSDYVGTDGNSDGIGDVERVIPDTPLTMDSYPWLLVDGWDMPYTVFRSVAWDNVNSRFWLCGEVSSSALSEVYYIPAATPTVMVPIPTGFPITFTALAVDNLGNLLIGGNSLEHIYYYVPSTQMGYEVSESSTGSMYGWNITGITFNPNDSRFYIVGNVVNEDRAVAFATAAGPLTGSPSYCYKDTSNLLNSPGIGTLRSISWNLGRDYALAVGDGVYRLDEWWGTGNPLSWSPIEEPQAGIVYNDISWDSDGWIEAGIVGQSGTVGKYWRYYHTNPNLQDGYTSAVPSSTYKVCAMKPPSSPKWLMIPASTEIPRINLEEKFEGGTVSFTSEYPQIFTVNIWKQSDVTHPNLLNTQVDADSTYTFFIEANYTSGGIDKWNDLDIYICAWYDNGVTGSSSEPGSWASDNFRTRQFNISYDPVADSTSMLYPTPAGPIPPIREFYVASYWSDPILHGADSLTHYLYINVTFGPQTWAATGPATPNAGAWDKNTALNDAGTWDLQVHMFDQFSTGTYNITYEEFGIKEFASISSSGSPTGSAPPGTTDYPLSAPCIIHYATNTGHYVTVSISDLHFGGDILDPKLIPATNLQIENQHSLSTVSTSDIYVPTYFPAANTPLYVWGVTAGAPLSPPLHGTELAGPGYTDYSAIASPPFELTEVYWWIDVPVSITSGIYLGTITVTIMD